jgi:hypothetical protein
MHKEPDHLRKECMYYLSYHQGPIC